MMSDDVSDDSDDSDVRWYHIMSYDVSDVSDVNG